MAPWQLPADVSLWIARLGGLLHGRLAWRLLPLLTGALFAQGRKTVAGWLRGGGLGKDYQAYYYFLGSLGRKVKSVATVLLCEAIRVIKPGERLLFALDDTPTKRAGPLVEGAGIHHNPTPGPSGQKFLYGHVWVTFSWVVRHRLWGTIGLPLLAFLYVRRDLQDQLLSPIQAGGGAGGMGRAGREISGQEAVGSGGWGLCQTAVFA